MKHELEISADYFQLYIQDDDKDYGDLSEAWTDSAVEKMAPHMIGVGTARNTDVPVFIEILESKPDVSTETYDRVNECSLQIDSGRIIVSGCTDYFPDATRIPCNAGIYDVLIGYKNLQSLSPDGLDGEDSYHVIMWPASTG